MCAWGHPVEPSSRRYDRIMRVLVIADDYDPETEPPRAEMVSRHRLDAVIITGDLSQSALAGVDTLAVPSMGVYGNHCDGTYLATLGVIDLHLNRVELQGISFVGLQRHPVQPRMNTALWSIRFPC